jgi:Co/Zn/Cd efflux system component
MFQMKKAIFKIAKMDCPSEEQMVRMKLDEIKGIHSLQFDIPDRKLEVIFEGDDKELLDALDALKLDTSLLSSLMPADDFPVEENQQNQRKTLWIILLINFVFFVAEMTTGLISRSMGLVADSLDMLADALVYAMALFAVGGTIARKKNIARFAGYFQIFLALTGFIEVIRRFIAVEKMPDFQTMIIVSVLALGANIVCLYLLQKSRSNEAHMQASMIFTSNDIIINTGVITAGVLVYLLESSYPDLIIGAIVFFVVARGAYRILQLAK